MTALGAAGPLIGRRGTIAITESESSDHREKFADASSINIFLLKRTLVCPVCVWRCYSFKHNHSATLPYVPKAKGECFGTYNTRCAGGSVVPDAAGTSQLCENVDEADVP